MNKDITSHTSVTTLNTLNPNANAEFLTAAREVLPADAPAFLTVREVARLLRLEMHAAYKHVRSGAIPAVRVGRSWRIPRSELERVLAERLEANKNGAAGGDPGSALPPATRRKETQ